MSPKPKNIAVSNLRVKSLPTDDPTCFSLLGFPDLLNNSAVFLRELNGGLICISIFGHNRINHIFSRMPIYHIIGFHSKDALYLKSDRLCMQAFPLEEKRNNELRCILNFLSPNNETIHFVNAD